MDPVKMVHKDGRERTVTTPAERVSAEFDGFTLSSGSKAAATRKANAKKSVAKTTVAPTATVSKTAAAPAASPTK